MSGQELALLFLRRMSTSSHWDVYLVTNESSKVAAATKMCVHTLKTIIKKKWELALPRHESAIYPAFLRSISVVERLQTMPFRFCKHFVICGHLSSFQGQIYMT